MDKYLIDDITWNDLDMEEVYNRMDKSLSSVGSEYLRQVLRTLLFDEKILKQRSERLEYLAGNQPTVSALKKIYKNLGRTKKVSFLDYIFRLKEIPDSKNGLHYVLAILLLAAIALIFIKPVLGVIALVVMIAINISVYFRCKSKVEAYFNCIKYLVSMVNAASAVLNKTELKNVPAFMTVSEDLKDSVSVFSSVRRGSWLITNSVSGSLIDVIMDYIRMMFHVDLIKFNNMKHRVSEHEEQINILYNALGETEACICIAEYRNNLAYYCRPDFYNLAQYKNHTCELAANDLYHPLVTEPVANTIITDRSVLLTGSNASGKSTFLKALAINQIFAQTIYTCLSTRTITTYYKVLSSMALSDNILGKESYFIVEIKSLKRIFDELSDTPVMCFVDEVLRGTNTVERIAASSRILEYLSLKNALVFAATHDIELTVLLKDFMYNYHFAETVSDGEVKFDYKLKQGASNTSNALKLIKSYGFEEEIVYSAEKRAEIFKHTGSWDY